MLHPKRCFVEKEIILPQLENYASRLRAANITVDRPNNMLDEEFELIVDIGLLSQVYANLFLMRPSIRGSRHEGGSKTQSHRLRTRGY